MKDATFGRATPAITGPHLLRVTDIDDVNRVFSDAFTERYRRDGLAGVRVPQLNPAIWRYAITGARDGAMVWRDAGGGVAAFNVAHLSGTEGWMGPLAVRPEWQGTGLGKAIVQAGMSWLMAHGARVIGLETMPRTVDNIGFYSSLGFTPGHLTVTLTLEAAPADGAFYTVSALAGRAREDVIHQCRDLVAALVPGSDFTRELLLTLEHGLGDVAYVGSSAGVTGFAVYHAIPLVEGRPREELRVLKLATRDLAALPQLTEALRLAARRAGTPRVAIRMQGAYQDAYRRLMSEGARVRWTDLRMTLRGYDERPVEAGMVLSNWEI